MADARQCWIGSIPPGLSEREILHELSAYNVRPWKLVPRAGSGSSQARFFCMVKTVTCQTMFSHVRRKSLCVLFGHVCVLIFDAFVVIAIAIAVAVRHRLLRFRGALPAGLGHQRHLVQQVQGHHEAQRCAISLYRRIAFRG